MAKRTVYVSNMELLYEIKEFWKTGIYSKKLVDMIYKMARKIANARNFYKYEFKYDMIQEGVIHALYKGIGGFHKDKTNPFSFLSTVIVHKYIEIIKKEKKNLKIKEILKDKESERIRDCTKERV